MSIIKIGCCGFSVSRRKYYEKYSLVELQNTFYNLPDIKWFKKIREEAPENFEFTVKAWQIITHPKTSPTWRKLRVKPGGDLNNYGYLKPTRENLTALEKVVEASEILRARIIVLQTPGTMPFNEDSIKWVEGFFEEALSIISGKNILLGWEPRGEWSRNTGVLEKILSRYGVIHIVDLFKKKPVSIPQNILYSRLHGIGEREVNYKYKYSDEDFGKLVEILGEIEFNEAYILFNNIYMFEDGLRFKEYIVKQGYKTL